MLGQSLKYDFPKGNSDPFDAEFNGNYFAYANAFSNLAKDLNEFSLNVLAQNIPMGYKTIILCKRLVLITNGLVLNEWMHPVENKKYFITSDKTLLFYRQDWERNVETNVLYIPIAKDASLVSSTWDNLDEGIEYAKQKSIEHACKMLISEMIESISWH